MTGCFKSFGNEKDARQLPQMYPSSDKRSPWKVAKRWKRVEDEEGRTRLTHDFMVLRDECTMTP